MFLLTFIYLILADIFFLALSVYCIFPVISDMLTLVQQIRVLGRAVWGLCLQDWQISMQALPMEHIA